MKGHRGREVCTVDDCGRLVHGRGLCGKHYQRMAKHGNTFDPASPPALCAVGDCCDDHYARGWCYRHYQQWHRTGNPTGASRSTLMERFWAKIAKANGCWVWQGYVMPNGYGTFAHLDGVSRLAHRVAYEVLVEPIPDDLTIDHLCRNRACVNPSHLEAVTMAENLRRARVAA